MLGKCPLPMSAEAAKEHRELDAPYTHDIGWHSGETDGCRRTIKAPRAE